MPRTIIIALISGLLTFLPTSVLAHHARTFFSQDFIEFEGELGNLSWKNPHISFTLTTDEGKTWKVESASIYMLQRMGVERNYLSSGMRVRVAGHQSNLSDTDVLGTNILTEEGQELLLFTGSTQRWSNRLVGGADRWQVDSANTVSIQNENRGLFRVWSISDNSNQQEYLPFTQQALTASESWDHLNNYIVRCEPHGMPRPMFDNPHPFEFTENGGNISLHSEEMDIVRTIHMGDAQDPSTQPASRLGYSVGRWQGNTLIVDTGRLNWPWFNSQGIPQSEDVQIEERFTLSEDQTRLDFKMTVIDSETFTAPATVERYWLALGEEIEDYSCEVF